MPQDPEKEWINRMARKEYDDDDGRTIVNMDVEGMPDSSWTAMIHKRSRREDREELRQKVAEGVQLTKSETRRYTWYAILAGLTVLGVVGGGTVLFIFILWLLWH